MQKIIIKGGASLQGEVLASGSKNAALPIIAASLLTKDFIRLDNLPHLKDVTTMLELFGSMGGAIVINESMSANISTAVINPIIHCDLVRTMRASILFLGPLLARFGYAEIALPGGCAIGSRPIDFHLAALRKMGATIKIEDNYIKASVKKGLCSAVINFDKVTVTGTENIMMAATLATGTTVINNAAMEPEICDLAECLIKMGARIKGHGSPKIIIEGVKFLSGCQHFIQPDRIEASTFLIAAAATRGKIEIKNVIPKHLEAILNKLQEAGAVIQCWDNVVALDMKMNRPKAVSLITKPYPGIPTDVQAQFTAMNTVAEGVGSITETIFENRFMHIKELLKMQANIVIADNTVTIYGVDHLKGARVIATDLRASASLVIAGLVASGLTVLDRIYHLDRGYECIEEKLKLLGADIKRAFY